MHKSFIFVFVVAVAALSRASRPPVVQCPNQNFDDLMNRISIIPCGKSSCKLPKNTLIDVEFRFKPERKVKELVNDVSANIVGIELPFVGTTGTSACGDIRLAETDEPAPCPLKPNIEYVYKKSFPVLSFYPKTKLVVYWSLNDGDRQVICFKVPAAIVDQTKHSEN